MMAAAKTANFFSKESVVFFVFTSANQSIAQKGSVCFVEPLILHAEAWTLGVTGGLLQSGKLDKDDVCRCV